MNEMPSAAVPSLCMCSGWMRELPVLIEDVRVMLKRKSICIQWLLWLLLLQREGGLKVRRVNDTWVLFDSVNLKHVCCVCVSSVRVYP